MPARTNPFQRLVAFVEQQLAAGGATVTESASLPEYEGSSEREVDVLIEAEVNRHPVRIAIECRDHQVPQDKTWIDQLIGKYRDIDVSEIVAVSSSGFTKGALEKAQVAHIRALTLEEALEGEWPRDLIRPFLKLFMTNHRMFQAIVHFGSDGPPLAEEGLANSDLFDANGRRVGSVGGMITEFANKEGAAAVLEYAGEIGRDCLIAGVDRSFCIQVPFVGCGRFVRNPDGKLREVVGVDLRFEVTGRIVPANMQHYRYNQVPVSIGTVQLDSEKNVAMAVVQFPGTAEPLRIAYTAITPRRST
jgi:hypothetical protein